MNYNAGREASESWLTDYSPLLLSYSTPDVGKALLSFCRTEMADDFNGADEGTIYAMLCVAFVQLFRRSAITQLRPFSSEGERQLSDLLRNFNVVSSADVEPPVVANPIIEQVAEDYRNLPTNEFNARLRADKEYERVFNELAASGGI